MKNIKGVRAITLISLVITIIVLLILAGITISQLVENGLFNKTQVAKQEYANATSREEDILKQYENAMNDGELFTGNSREYTPINYSTSEQDTGIKWINGKTIYQKTFQLGTLNWGGTLNIVHNIVGLGDKVSVEGYFLDNNNTLIPLNFIQDNDTTHGIKLTFSDTNITIYARTTSTSTHQIIYGGHVTVKYTKSTDIAN